MMFTFLICVVFMKGFEIQNLDPQYQVAYQSVKIEDEDYLPNKYFAYGIWSRYNPLSTISQVGTVGLFNSNCFHLHNIVDIVNKEINLIYYDCLDYQAKEIIKEVKLVTDDDEQKVFNIKIGALEYENVWHFLEIIQNPFQRRFELLIISLQKIEIHSIDVMKYPFKGRNLKFTFGDGLIVSNTRIETLQMAQKFSYFPGKIQIQQFQIFDQPIDFDWFDHVKELFQESEFCTCQPNINFKIPDQNLNQQFKGESISQNTNCDTFVLQGWFRIQEIITDENEFVYPFLKLAANFENPNLTNNNLSPVQISYKLSDIQNQIIITTYSFTFPQVSIDFSNNPFLKVKTFDIINSIQLWHKIQIKMVQSQLEIYIQFYDNLSIQEYSYQLEVHQFSQVQFKIQFGNLQQMEKNYLQIQIQNFLFLNCGDNFLAQNCHYSCQECDGPTYKDCLSCSEESKRSYLPEHKVCVCPYDTIDNQICIGYVEANLQLVEEPFLNNECQYGYFELDNECIRCPSIIKHNFISCLNCIQNPKTFSQNPLCHDGLFLSQSNNTEKTTWYYPDQLLFNGIEFNLLLISDDLQYTLTNLNLLFKDFQFKQSNFISFCFGDYPQCYHQNDQSCIQIYISIVGQRCFACTSGYKLENGQCNLETLNLPEAYCNHPYYITSTNKCQLCPIQNCKQCFEYQNVDSDFKSTLYKNFENFDQDQAVKIGCAMCDQNFIFDFTVGICLKQKTKIISCLRSFINFDGTEICTLSSEPDFTIAPEIINCQKYYSNCLQCILTPQSKIQCVQCEYGYVSSIVTGNCYTTQEFWLFFRNSSSVIQVERNQKNVNILLIQSFMMLFLPHQYYYPSSQDLVEVSIMCKENYHLTTYLYCVSDCSSDCQHCQEAANNLICNTCLLNYYQKPQRVEENGQCISCSNLCEYCQVRNQEEIQEISSNFILQESNAQYTRKCIKPVDDPSIIINPYIQNAKYCFNKDCYNRFSFSYFFGSCIFDRYKPGSQDLDINVQYCNHVGTDQLTINFIFKIQFQTTCGFNIPLQIKSTLRNRIFSLKKLTMNLFSIYDDLLMVKYLTTITNFDLVQIYNINFKLEDGFAIQNNNQKVDVTLKNLKIIESNFQDLIIFQNQIFGDIQIFNLQIIDSTFLNSSFFNFSDSSKVQEIIIKNLLFINCIVNSSVLFNFKLNNIKIHIEEIVIKNCSILNSLIFSFEPGQNQVNQVNFIYMLGVEIIGCSFTSSNFFKTNNKFLLKASNLNFKNNYVKGSAIMAFNDNTELKYVKSNQNILKESTILSSLSVLNQSRVQLLIDEFEDNQSTFQESSLIIIHQSLQNDDYVVYLKNIKVWENKIDDTSHQQNQLFKLNCHYLQIQDSQFLNLKNVIVFTLFEIYQIIFESIQFENTHQQYKIPITKQCSNQVYQTNQLLKVVGFQYLSFSNIQIINQFGINFSIINIILSDQFNFNIIGQVKMINLLFKGNILLKDKQTTSVTLLSVNSQQNLNIQLIDFQFIQNFINQQVDEPLETQTGLLYLYSLDSTLQIHQLLCQQNTLTNSTTPFISLYAYLIEITNLNIFNQNILNQTLWQDFYDFQLDDQLNQDQMNLLIQSTFKILNQGILIVASSFSCTNSLFQNILGLKSFIFEIKTQGKGIIKINNLWANSISTNLQEQGSSGCINVISINSNLNLQLNEVKFSNIFHRMTSSLFTIEPSLKSNFILLNNVIIIDCISLMNTVMLIKFQTDVKQQSLVKINNMTIQQREESWINLFQKIGSFTQSEINDIKSDNNALILFENCRVELNNLKFNGIAISPILKFSNALQIKLIDCKFTNLQQFTSFNLIRIDQTLMMKQVITIQNLKIINSSLYQKYSIEIPILQEQNYKIVGCSLWKNSSISSDVLYSDILNQIYSSNQQSNSILFVQSIFESNSLFFQNLDIFGNNGSDFSNGVITFDVQNFSNFILENIHCYQNTVKENGCINIVIQNYINQTIRMKDSFFIQNKGSFGGAISIQNVKLKLTNCKIVSNKVSNFGGGMYLQLKDDDFQIKQTIITSNQALNGGGIYINKESNIKTNNLIQSFLLYNKATYFGDNLVESPHHLDLSINNKEMQSKKLIINKLHNQYLDLKPYSIIEQGIALYTIYLMIPSNQVIAKYQLYQPQGLKYFSYITSLGLKLKNSLNEQIQNYLNFTCILKNQIIYGDNLVEVGEESHQFLLEYDLQKEYYDLGELSFTLDPYQQDIKMLQIKISCQSSQQEISLNYLINARSLKCQLGEFYVSSGCQVCQSSQGFYSVVYDAIKCSIFDKTKFKNITENTIELLQGFWRPHYLSDQIEKCFKNTLFCQGGWGQVNQICSNGHIGALCEECDIYNVRGDGKYFKNQQDSNCISCFGVQDSIIPFITASIWSFISIIITLRSIDQSNQLYKSLKINYKFSKIIFKLSQGNESFLIKMLLNYFWIFSVIFTFNIQFSFTFTFIDSASNTSYSMANNLDCYLSENQSIQLIYAKIITMIVLILLQFILILIGFLIYFWFQKQKLNSVIFDTISNTLLYLYVSSYGGLIKMYFSILSKRDISNESYIQGDVSLIFGSRDHIVWMFSLVIPGLGIFSIFIPLSLFILMYFKKNKLDTIQIRKYFCYLFNEYDDQCYYWEQIKIIQKTIMILIITYFETYILLKASLLGLCLLFYQLFAVRKKPFILSNLNHLDLFSAQICSITIFLAAAKYVAEQENNLYTSMVLQTLIVFLCLRLAYPFIMSILQEYYKKYYFMIINYLHLILKKVKSDSMLTYRLQTNIKKWRLREKRKKDLTQKLRKFLLLASKSQLQNKQYILSTIQSNYIKVPLNYRDSNQYFMKLDSA